MTHADQPFIEQLTLLSNDSTLVWHRAAPRFEQLFSVEEPVAQARSCPFRGGTIYLLDYCQQKDRAMLGFERYGRVGVLIDGKREPLAKLLSAAGFEGPMMLLLDQWLEKPLLN